MSIDHATAMTTHSPAAVHPAEVPPVTHPTSARSAVKASSPNPGASRNARATRLARRTTADKLRDALMVLCDHQGQIVTHAEKPWASITFAGARHTLTLRFTGIDAVTAGEEFIDALPDHEFTLPGQLVADATIRAVDQRLVRSPEFPAPELVVECELLLLEDA